jgi:energy-coupling factor transport system substrate-specific component
MSSNQPHPLLWHTRWSVRDVVALVVTAVVLGVVFYLWDWAVQLLTRLLGDVAVGLFYGVWYWAGLLLAYAIRKPGAALLGELGAALVEFGLGAPLGMLVLVLGFVQGLALEVVFAWARYNYWGLVVMVIAGALAGVADFAVNLVAPPLQLHLRPGGIIIAMFWLIVLSGAALGGLVCKILGDRLLAIPAVRNFLGTQASQGE